MTIECVPNFSEGRDRATIAALEKAVRDVPGALLLNSTSDVDHNRTVLTFAGEPAAVAEAAFAAVAQAVARIDLAKHSGVHPRLGAADVVPFVPMEGATLEDCATLAHAAGQRIWSDLGVPVYFYEAAALRPECSRLENVRKAAAESSVTQFPPDIGEGRHPTAGYCTLGARGFLVAWNVLFESDDLATARAIARAIRESGGGLPAVKAIGLPLPSRGRVQVSINLVDFRRTPLHVVFDAVAALCREQDIRIEGSELIGMIPQAALYASAGHDLRWLNMRPQSVLESSLRMARRGQFSA
jgi:glutamate formiminotransferase/glutamate formiminotransferase/formiminotetrahydrofolate cyclodeaminase